MSKEFERTFYQMDYRNTVVHTVMTWTLVGLTGLSLSVSLAVPTRMKTLKWLLHTSAFITAVGAAGTSRMRYLSWHRARDVEDLGNQMLAQQVVIEQMAPVPPLARMEIAAELATAAPAGVLPAAAGNTGIDLLAAAPCQLFKVEDLLQRDDEGNPRYPHFMVVGSTGDGKTLLAEYLMDLERDRYGSHTIYVSPTTDGDSKDGKVIFEMNGCTYVGSGWSDDLRPVAFQYEDIRNFYRRMLQHVYKRYTLHKHEAVQLGFINIVADESKEANRIDVQDPRDNKTISVGQANIRISSIARKRFVRVISLTTSNTVEVLDIKGEGDLRRNFVFVYMGEHAVDQLKSCISNGLYPETTLSWFLAMQDKYPHRAVMIDTKPCLLPDLSKYRETKARLWGNPVGRSRGPEAVFKTDIAELVKQDVAVAPPPKPREIQETQEPQTSLHSNLGSIRSAQSVGLPITNTNTPNPYPISDLYMPTMHNVTQYLVQLHIEANKIPDVDDTRNLYASLQAASDAGLTDSQVLRMFKLDGADKLLVTSSWEKYRNDSI